MVSVYFGLIFSYTWLIWAFAFVFCLVSAIRRAVREAADGEGRNSARWTFLAARFFSVIIGGLTSLLFVTA